MSLGIAILSVSIASISQVLLKKSAVREYNNKIREYLNIYVITGYLLLFLSMVLTIIAYKNLPYLSVAMVEVLGFIFVPILSKLFFKENISKKKIIGIMLIMIGIIIYNTCSCW